ncbi:hypothetical protein GALL_468800 [mine drainage metagenome]|uniref:Lipoprotein n=1 Tax=mine drainage metagenome TaxID=410659 RepID=A0A1J5PV91_9ZZZZ
MRRILLSLGVVVALAGCGSGRAVSSDPVVAKARYVSPEPPSLTLITSIRNDTGNGAHSALLINASQRVIFDPAGNYFSAQVPQKGDVLYGVSPPVLQSYLNFQSSKGFHVVAERVQVSPEVAELALQKSVANGAAASGLCSDNVSSIVRKLPGFTSLPVSFFPRAFMRDFGKLPGVVVVTYLNGAVVPNGSPTATAIANGARAPLADQ